MRSAATTLALAAVGLVAAAGTLLGVAVLGVMWRSPELATWGRALAWGAILAASAAAFALASWLLARRLFAPPRPDPDPE